MKVGVIGAGAWGKNHVKTLYEMGELGVVIELNEELRDNTRAQFPEIPCLSSWEEFLADNTIERSVGHFVIATPAHTHCFVGCTCLEAGKDVLIEKPMTLSVADAEILIAKAAETRRTLMVGHLLLFQPAISFVKKFIDGGKLGKVYSLHQVRAKLGRARAYEDVLWSFGVHDIAVLLYLIGELPEKVRSMGHCGIQSTVADDVHLQMNFLSGVVAHLHSSWLWPQVERKLTIIGSEGMLVYDEINQNVVWHHKTIFTEDLSNRDMGSEIIFKADSQPLKLELEHFVHCCTTGETPISDGRNGLEVIRVLEMASKN